MAPPITLKIKFKSATLAEFIERYAGDLSRSGIFIRTKQPLQVGTHLKFEFQLTDATPLLSGEGTVTWVRPFDPGRVGTQPGMGVHFDKLSTQSVQTLDNILAEKTRRGDAHLESRFDAGARDAKASSETDRDAKTPLPSPLPGLSREPNDFSREDATRVMQPATTEALLAATRGAGGATATEPPHAENTAAQAPQHAVTPPPTVSVRSETPVDPRAEPVVALQPERAVTPQPVPVQPEPVPVQPEPVPVQPEPVPVQPEPVPVQPEPPEPIIPSHEKPAATQPEPIVPAHEEPAPAQPEPTLAPQHQPVVPTQPEPAIPPKPDPVVPSESVPAAAAKPEPAGERAPTARPAEAKGAPLALILIGLAVAAAVAYFFILPKLRGAGESPQPTSSQEATQVQPAPPAPSLAPAPTAAVAAATAQAAPAAENNAAPTAIEAKPVVAGIEIAIASDPPGATIKVDGAPIGVAPTTAQLDPSKPHELEFSLKGYQDQTIKDVKAKAGLKLSAKLVEADKFLELSSTPPDAEVLLDGKHVGRTGGHKPLRVKISTAKPHKVMVRKTGFADVWRDISTTIGFEEKEGKLVAALAVTLAPKDPIPMPSAAQQGSQPATRSSAENPIAPAEEKPTEAPVAEKPGPSPIENAEGKPAAEPASPPSNKVPSWTNKPADKPADTAAQAPTP